MEAISISSSLSSAISSLPVLGRQALLSGIAAIVVAFPLAAWFSLSISRRLRRMVKFAHPHR